MRRREFLELLGKSGIALGTFAATADPVSVGRTLLEAYKEHIPAVFDPQKEYGEAIHYFVPLMRENPEFHTTVIERLRVRAHEILPINTVYEIRQMVPINYGREGGLAWYHNPEMLPDDDYWEHETPVFSEVGGYYEVSRQATIENLPPSLSDG